MLHLSKPQKLIYDMEKYSGGAISVICGSMLLRRKVNAADLQAAANELHRINAALRTRIVETDAGPMQIVEGYAPQGAKMLRFSNKLELTRYAEAYAKEPLPLYGQLCEFTVVLLPEQSGLLVKLHHIISDAWTLALLGTQCNAILRGETPSAYSYEDHLQTEDTYLKSERCAKDRTFFLQQFKKCEEVTYLSERQSNSVAARRRTFEIDREKTGQLVNYAKSHGASIFALFMTAVAAYFSRVTQNTEKFYLGTAVLNRAGAKEKNTAGMFINMIPLLMELENGQTFSHNLEAVKATAFSAFRHQKFNYDDILTAIRQEYGSGERLYDVMFSYQNATITGGVESIWYHCGAQIESLQIHIDDRDNEDILCVHFDYQTEKFTEQEIEWMYAHMLNLLFDAIEHEQKKLVELELFTAGEKRRLLHDFNDTAADYPRDKCVHTLFEEQATRTPDKTAVVACDRTLTYRHLNEQANRIAHGLIAHGVKPGDIVAFMLPRRSYLIAAMFGILKVGAAYLPIDPDYPQDRIDYMLEDSRTAYFITEENIHTLLANETTADPALPLYSDSLCYCIYTSGSTGKPKGTLLTHKNVANYVNNNNNNVVHAVIREEYQTIVSVTTVGFDIFVTESILPLINGMTVLFANEKQAKVQIALNALLRENPADVMQTTPTKMRSLIGDFSQCEYLQSLKAIILGGEALDSALVSDLRKLTAAHIFNIYGPTETTVWSTNTEILPTDDITIGRPIANTQIHIVDKHLNLVPIGVTGELCIAGDGVGAGYLNRPELTAEKFIDNPFGAGRLYKTGDLAYWREDGKIVYVGRNDFQVKIRGLRIELGEIENALQTLDAVSQAAVVVRKNEAGRQFICAFYTGQETDSRVFRTAIGQKLPKYMLPHSFTHLESMPLTSSGKVNRKALPEVDLNNIANAVIYAAPKTEQETVLVNAVQSVLHIKRAGTADNFFDLGGDSLKAIELIAELEQAGYSAEVKTVFEANTLEELAARLTTAKTVQEAAIPSGPLPATDAQVRVYTAQAMAGGTAYNVPYALRVERLDPTKLQAAVSLLVERHESLRTRFENRGGQIMQIVEDSANCTVEVLESEDISAFIRPFDLETAPLMRVGYYQNTVMLDMHHIITDGSSMPILFRELNELYMGRTLDKSPVQYREFAAQKHNHMQAEQYWRSVFADEPPVLEMNTDYPRQNRQTFSGAALYETFSGSLHERIREKCRTANITPYAFYMGAFYVLLSKFSGNEDVVVGVPASGRTGKFLNTIGMFVNTLALRNRPEGGKTVSEFLREIKSVTAQALNNQEYPFGELVKALGIHAENRHPLFVVIFAYQSEEMTDIYFGDKPAELLPIPITIAKCDFTFNIYPRSGDMVVMVEYCTDLYKEQTIWRLLKGYRTVLAQMLDGEKRLADISAVTYSERQRLLYSFNDTAVDYPKDKCVHALFEEQVERTPDKTAVIACDRTLTYRELNEQANRIAHGLIDQGVKPGDIVAFALPRRSYLIAAMFGILKAGAAYLPIDLEYPQDRINYMLEDSKAAYFITKENIQELLGNENAANTMIPATGNSLCYCIYTSGSTGKPKGALLTHQNIGNYVSKSKNGIVHSVISNDCKSIVSLAATGFDMFTTEGVLSVVDGITILLADEEQTRMQSALNEFLNRNPADVLQTTPTKIRMLACDASQLEYLKSLKVILLGGEIVDDAIVSELKKISTARIFNMYGPTETTVWSTKTEILSVDDITIGTPIANTQIHIVDKHLQLVPIGVTGELCIAGDGVGAGYLNRPELMAEKFIDNPFGEGKLYKTGDLAYWREDGNIVYVGRNDFQVKIRGLRIELGEIENAIQAMEGISQAAVVVRKNETGRQFICAFYTGQETDGRTFRAVIGEKLPKYMLPHSFTHLESMPLTSSGKVNRKALPEVDLNNISSTVEYEVPIGEMEKRLAALMEETLGYSPIGRNDDFFDLGGDSLRAIEFVTKAHGAGIYFALQNVFNYPTVESLCNYLQKFYKKDEIFASEQFHKYTPILERNTCDPAFVPERHGLGTVLLTGGTGFLGAHIFDALMNHGVTKIYCVVRGGEDRLRQRLQYYFGERYTEELGNIIIPITGDLERSNIAECLPEQVDYVIHAAASVKHYGSWQYFKSANIDATQNMITYAKRVHAKLLHVSTISVSGNSMADQFDGYISEEEKHFSESSLYIGQPLDNVYVRSKFEAEALVLDAIRNGLQANIVRMGNLTNRKSDLKFQPNYAENAFLKRVKAVLELGCVPDYLMSTYAEFSPVDAAAEAITRIAEHMNDRYTVFHINSDKELFLDRMLDYLEQAGRPLRVVSGEEFAKLIRDTINSQQSYIFEALLNDLDQNDQIQYDSNIRIENSFTVQYLQRLGYEWPEIDSAYIEGYLRYFTRLGYFGEEGYDAK